MEQESLSLLLFFSLLSSFVVFVIVISILIVIVVIAIAVVIVVVIVTSGVVAVYAYISSKATLTTEKGKCTVYHLLPLAIWFPFIVSSLYVAIIDE